MDESNNKNLGEVSGGWGQETESYGSFILDDSEFKSLQKAYPDLKIRKSALQSKGVPEGSDTYTITSKSEEWMDPEKITDMVKAKFGEAKFITYDGNLYVKK